MAYAQWVSIIIKNRIGKGDIKLKNAVITWGKFYKTGNKDDEISVSDVDAMTVTAGSDVTINACGRSDASSGTEGSIELWIGDQKIGKVYWDCPWGSKSNDFQVDTNGDDYVIATSPWNRSSGAIGNVTVSVAKIA